MLFRVSAATFAHACVSGQYFKKNSLCNIAIIRKTQRGDVEGGRSTNKTKVRQIELKRRVSVFLLAPAALVTSCCIAGLFGDWLTQALYRWLN